LALYRQHDTDDGWRNQCYHGLLFQPEKRQAV